MGRADFSPLCFSKGCGLKLALQTLLISIISIISLIITLVFLSDENLNINLSFLFYFM